MNQLTASKTSREDPMQFDHLEIVGIAIEAGLSIMDIYDSSGQIEVQSKDDDSPLTKADIACLLYTSPSPRDATLSRMPSSA